MGRDHGSQKQAGTIPQGCYSIVITVLCCNLHIWESRFPSFSGLGKKGSRTAIHMQKPLLKERTCSSQLTACRQAHTQLSKCCELLLACLWLRKGNQKDQMLIGSNQSLFFWVVDYRDTWWSSLHVRVVWNFQSFVRLKVGVKSLWKKVALVNVEFLGIKQCLASSAPYCLEELWWMKPAGLC